MPRLSPVSPKKLVAAFEKLGFRQSRQVGSHLKLVEEPACTSGIIIPSEIKPKRQSRSLASPRLA